MASEFTRLDKNYLYKNYWRSWFWFVGVVLLENVTEVEIFDPRCIFDISCVHARAVLARRASLRKNVSGTPCVSRVCGSSYISSNRTVWLTITGHWTLSSGGERRVFSDSVSDETSSAAALAFWWFWHRLHVFRLAFLLTKYLKEVHCFRLTLWNTLPNDCIYTTHRWHWHCTLEDRVVLQSWWTIAPKWQFRLW